ncbi:MAG: SMC-Scp complex subunit ScpB [Vicinamibacterales bacterium]
MSDPKDFSEDDERPIPGEEPISDEPTLDEALALSDAVEAVQSAIEAGDVSEAAPFSERGTAELKSIVEALIFASPDPLTPKALSKLLSSEPKEDIQRAIDQLKADYDRPGGLQLVEVAGGFQIVTRPDLHEWVRRLFHERTTQKLSVQALETLAVVAYRQPVTALEITEIRGVNTSGVMNTLLERHLIKIVGRKQVVGRPFMYATTKDFLIRFGLNDLSDLPKVDDMAEALGIESPLLVEQAPVEEQLPLEEPDEELAAQAVDEELAVLEDADPSSDDGSSGSIH